jgi:hypothetical protein
MTSRAELSSLSAGVRDLVERVSWILETLAGDERDSLGAELLDVERALKTAERRLERLMTR